MPKRKKSKVVHQTGKSNIKRDKRYTAKAVGKRRSASGKVYYETRRNRSDKSRKKRI